MARFDARAVLVTGASSGIGAATARRFGAEGARVMVSGLDEDGSARVVAEIGAAGGEAHDIHGDLSDRAFHRHLFDETLARLGRLDVLVNNAGLSRRGTAEETSDENWDLTLAVNLSATFFLSRAAVPVMRRQGGGAIVNTASELGIVATTKAPAYCATKAAVLQLTRAMALDHARDGIRINAVCPGPVDTELLRDFGDDGESALRDAADATPMGRIGTPDEIAAAILFLASDDASFMTGAAMVVDGGISID